MKLRIKGPTLRLRLTQGEIRALEEQSVVEERVPFAAGVSLIYRLKRDAAAREISASYDHGVLEIRVPEGAARQWCTTELVTLAHDQALPEGVLRITLEKDYACLAPRADEDESDNFPHPEAARGKSC
ncbi:MAG TPA: Hsp20/alpha crystallin family protein [Steroidobacteraceae bacterium]|nr:Hsp20/alpha crystallin family protein [Steroidobacteraceae bacterium]